MILVWALSILPVTRTVLCEAKPAITQVMC
jgi:hypothetical protein